MAPISDESIVAAVLAGDREQYRLLVERYEARIFRAMWRASGQREQAEELTQAVFCRAYFALHRFDPEYRFSTWIYRIAHNLCINHRKRSGRELHLSDLDRSGDDPDRLAVPMPADTGPSLQARVEQRDVAGSIGLALARLPEDFREILVLRHFQELSYAEICDLTGLPMGTVKSRLARARRQLASELAGQV